MIKLLLVDDEIETREGLRDFIPWEELKIDEVQLSSDGADGIELSAIFKPDIIITDIRMRKVNGIEFATKIREFLPNCKIIFISGYSDKEYLKSAIQLKAISYVEKPINLEEIKAAIEEAVEMHLDQLKVKHEIENSNLLKEKNLGLIKEECALALISENPSIEDISTKLRNSNIAFTGNNNYATIIVKIKNNKEIASINHHSSRNLLDENIRKVFDNYLIASLDNDSYMVHIGYEYVTESSLFKNSLESLFNNLCDYLGNSFKIFIAVGAVTMGLLNIKNSYNTAILAMRELFFTGYNQIVFYYKNNKAPYILVQPLIL